MDHELTQLIMMLQLRSLIPPDLSSHLKCILCSSILKDARQTPCGCKVCYQCIKEYLKNGSKRCPGIESECTDVSLAMNKIYQDNAINKEITNLVTKCPFLNCTISSPIKDMVKHVVTCEFRDIQCERCKETICMVDKKYHDDEQCEMRITDCKYCFKKIAFKEMKEIHLNIDKDELCTKYVANCPNNCDIIEKINLKDHLTVCLNKKVDCPYKFVDCKVNKMVTGHLKTHLIEDGISHSSSLINSIQELEVAIEELKSELENQKCINEELLEINTTSSKSALHIEKVVEDLNKRNNSSIPNFKTKEIFRNGNFIWKIDDFESKRNEARNGGPASVTSDSFYTCEFGYKLGLRIYPGGDGIGKGTHLSVFFVIMRGEFDDILSWPFKQKISLSILDQQNSRKHYSETLMPDGSISCYGKPLNESNIASGSPKFMLLSSLERNSVYCPNDHIYVKISVHP